MEEYIGRKVLGFKFKDDGRYGVGYVHKMDDYIGKEGIITGVYKKEHRPAFFNISFNGDSWSYPCKLVLENLIDENVNLKLLFKQIEKL